MYAFSDVHGNWELYEKVKTFLQEHNEQAYFLGDACDRGKDGWKIIKDILANPNLFFYIKGNHEDMLATASPWWFYNGGYSTYLGMKEDTDQEQDKIVRKLRNLPTVLSYKNKDGKICVMTHAGFTPETDEPDYLWDREHVDDEWPIYSNYKNLYIIHGHTPIAYIDKKTMYKEACSYCGNHKICIDFETYNTNAVCLLNLDTFESIVFDCEEDK